ncbi:serine/threonine-protein kinase Smg1 [Musca autumnalis]|uniref:serine/threonine-protein kinase Smg1 n=1 Tax=Musca autumnalis TaxID=221902 RepID=UPI003CF56315
MDTDIDESCASHQLIDSGHMMSAHRNLNLLQPSDSERDDALNGLRNFNIHDSEDMIDETWDMASEAQNHSVGANSNSSSLYEHSNKFNRYGQQIAMLSEDLRISKILRRLMAETNRKAAIDLCNKLDAAVRNASNASYICRSFEILFDNMITVLRKCPAECLENASIILGIMGYINRYDFVVYKNNLTKTYANNKCLRRYLMTALRTTISCDAVNLDLKPYSERLLSLLKEYLENAEIGENFIAISETISELSRHYKQSFIRHFTDIVDIIIGWHLEIEQTAYLKRHCAKVLQQLAEYFLSEMDFTFGLLGQFIEDIEACGDEILAENITMKSKQQTEARVGAFIGAFTSIIKAMVSRGFALNNFSTSANLLHEARNVVNKVTKQCFQVVALISEDTIINLNEFYCVISTYDKSVENLCDLERVIELQLAHLSAFNENQVASFLYMVLNIVRQYRTQLPLSFVSLVMSKENRCLQDLKLNCSFKSYKLLLKIYHEILNIKNVPLLQEAYRHILKDVNEVVGYLKGYRSPSKSQCLKCELLLSFYLAALSVMACQTSSIIGMYALNPSILELLINNCQAANEALWTKYPALHHALLSVIVEHSSKNYNFRQSSRLLVQHQDSPASENFNIILKFLASIMRWYTSNELLNWFEQLMLECKDNYAILVENNDFLEMCENTTLFAKKKPKLCLPHLRTIVEYPKMPAFILSIVAEVVFSLMEGTDKELLVPCCELLAVLPLDISLRPNLGDNASLVKHKDRLKKLFHWYKATGAYSGLRAKCFKTFIESLEPSSLHNSNNTALYQLFTEKSFVYLQKENVSQYLEHVQENIYLLNAHLQYEAARYCVQQKLRTTLGKPQETFLAIEAIIMKYARFLAEKDSFPDDAKSIENVMKMQESCRMLLGFLENLEKHIYNAAEGTAYAMFPAEKPAKTFFRVNASTCAEWFKRIRTAVNLIALHSMESELVIRYSESILENDSIFTNRGYLDRTVTMMAWALFNCRETETLNGLLLWLKSKHCKGFEWIQCVADHSSGHLEKAASGYLSFLNDNTTTIDTFTKEFIERQLTDCLYNTGKWTDILKSSNGLSYSQTHLQYMDAIYENALKHENATQAIWRMTEWDEDVKIVEPPNQMNSFSCYEIVSKLRDACLTRSFCVGGSNISWFEHFRDCLYQALHHNVSNSHEPGTSLNLLNEILLLNHVSNKMELNDNIVFHTTNPTPIPTELKNKILCWSLVVDKQMLKHNLPLLLGVVHNSRLDTNLTYSQSLLEQFFRLKGIDKPLKQIVQDLKTNDLILDFTDLDVVSGVEELIKNVHTQNNSIADSLELASVCCIQIMEKSGSPPSYLPNTISNILLTMCDWMGSYRLHNHNIAYGKQFQKLQNLLPDVGFCSSSEKKLPTSEYAIGKLLNGSILSKDSCGEAWFSFGNWCYRWGKKLMETSGSGDHQDLNRNHVAIQNILGDNIDNEIVKQIVNFLNMHIINIMNDDNVENEVYVDGAYNPTEILERELKMLCNISTEQLNAIISLWRQEHKGVYGFYEEATRAYFKYLAIQSDAVSQKKTAISSEVEDCTFVTTTLRLLRLIVKHAQGLQDVLEEGLRNTPLRPWKVIVPQLFSRLNHHENYVRRSVSDLLCRLAVNQPQLIIFPAVVGAQQELKHCGENTIENNQLQLSNCFMVLLNSLSSQCPDMVLQVQMLVKELRRVTLLWEEYWIHSLAQLYAEYSQLYNSLDAESKKTANLEEMLPKYDIFRQHLLSDFKKIASVTEKDAETNYERSFKERFKSHIDTVLKELETPKDPTKPYEYWQRIKQLYNTFQQKPLRGNSSTMRVYDVSPVLANMRNTSIAMPGVDTYEKSAVYIKSVESTVFVLPTKTKPKKLSFCGSNGHNYTYLFKGQEDLHLDERIMQFLSISNSMMIRSNYSKTSSDTDCFRAHHYSVIPLGPQSGLISWVDNCTPLFAIYKKWQQREALLKQQQKERQSFKSNETAVQSPCLGTTRPSELFYNKLTPLLAERNLKISDSRKQWPIHVLKQVLRELSAETPNDLLAKEIWCYSSNAVDWRKSVRRYTTSLAVMSIIGYVIGLGDRHLDNILIKLDTGEIVHIDYNVCFEKGKTLRVPEKVPFRLTQNLRAALGLIGTEGSYRMTCSHVLKVLRKERETLLTLLEAFVYDPLVDWTISDDGSTTRATSAHNAAIMISSLASSKETHLSPKDMLESKKYDVEWSRQSLIAKIAEVKPVWLKYRNSFDERLRDLVNNVQHLLDIRESISQLEQERSSYTKQLAMIRELDALGSARGSHALNTVTQRYKTYKRDLNAFENIKQLIQQTVNDLEVVQTTYFHILLDPNEVMKLDVNQQTNTSHSIDECDLLKDIFPEYKANNLYTAYKFAKEEMENCFLQIQQNAVECKNLLLIYSKVKSYFPRSKILQNHLVKYKCVFSRLIKSNVDFSTVDTSTSSVGVSIAEHCQKYFDSLIKIYMELKANLSHAQFELEQRQKQQIVEREIVTDSIVDFLNSNTHHNRQAILRSAASRIHLAHKSFVVEEIPFRHDGSNSQLSWQINFLQMLDTFVTSLNIMDSVDILQLIIQSLIGLNDFQTALMRISQKLLRIFIMENNKDIEDIEACNEIKITIDEADSSFENTVSSLQKLQDHLYNLQEVKCHDSIDRIMVTSWNINIIDYIKSCRDEVILQLISQAKLSASSLLNSDMYNVFDLRCFANIINDTLVGIQNKLIAELIPFVVDVVQCRISNLVLEANDTVTDNPNICIADQLCGKLYLAIEQEYRMQYHEWTASKLNSLLEEYRLIVTFYYWLNDELLPHGQIKNNQNDITSKQEFLSKVHNTSQVLVVCKSTMMKIKSELDLHRKNIDDFLALPSQVTGAVQLQRLQLKEAVSTTNNRYTYFLNLATRLTEYLAVLLQFEISGGDGPFEALIKQFREQQDKLEAGEICITPVERSLVQLLDPEGKIDQCWIENISDLLDEMIFSVQKKMSDFEKQETAAAKTLQECGQQLQILIDSSLRMDLRQLLKIITKTFKMSPKIESGEICQHIRELQQTIKAIQNIVNALQMQLFPGDFETLVLKQIRAKVDELSGMIHNSDSLMERITQMDMGDEQFLKLENSIRNDNLKESTIINSQVGEQKRNAYAVSVWKRIRMKLEGRDPDPNRRSSVTEQVDHVITEATNEDNLASLYEGWTPWV